MTLRPLAALFMLLAISALPLRAGDEPAGLPALPYHLTARRSADDPPADEVLASFKLTADGFESRLGRVAGDLYRGRTSAGGHGDRLDLNGDGRAELRFDAPCGFLMQLEASQPQALETNRATQVHIKGLELKLEKFAPLSLAHESQ